MAVLTVVCFAAQLFVFCINYIVVVVFSYMLFFMGRAIYNIELLHFLPSHSPGGSTAISWQGCQMVFSMLPHNSQTCKCISLQKQYLILPLYSTCHHLAVYRQWWYLRVLLCRTAGGMCFVCNTSTLQLHIVSLLLDRSNMYIILHEYRRIFGLRLAILAQS